jgi:uncharacterized membrane protein
VPTLLGWRRRVLYVALYEAVAIVSAAVGLAWVADRPLADAGIVSVIASVIAVVWNYLYNWAFERWEASQRERGRSLWRRVVHALGFELGLVILLVPALAWWLKVTLWQALLLDLGLVLFFLVYTFVFNWAFDRVFGLPESAQEQPSR